jgi:adenosylcobinamide-phosphate synthase
VTPLILLTGLIYYLLLNLSPVLAWIWNVLVLYCTMSLRQFSRPFTEISQALKEGELPRARELLRQWNGLPADELSSGMIARVAIELGLVHSHRYLFGVIVCFVLLPGPMGAVLYRLADFLSERWGSHPGDESGEFGQFAASAFKIIDWLPSRLTAGSFAIAGNFEDAVYCWRAQSESWVNHAQGIILASGAGALGVRLGDSLQEAGSEHYRPELGIGEEADTDFLQSATGLIWRALILWIMLLLLLGIANWAG